MSASTAPETVITERSPTRWLLLALAVGLLLRLVGQSTFPLGMDELVTVIEAKDLGHGSMIQGPEARPLYIALQLLLRGLAHQR